MSVIEFGKRLRFYRERSIDPDAMQSNNGTERLTQARLGEQVGAKLGLAAGYSGAAVSDWERGQSAIGAHDRPLLLAIVEVLCEHQRIRAPAEADDLLAAGGYRALDVSERQRLFPDMPETKGPQPPAETEVVIRTGEGLRRLREYLNRSPVYWMDGLWDNLGHWLTTRTPVDGVVIFGWLAIWWVTCQWLFPLTRFPFANRAAMTYAALGFVGVNLLAPVVIAFLLRPWNGDGWRAIASAPRHALAFAVQGALIGYQVGGWLLFLLALVIFHTTGGRGSLSGVEWLSAWVPLSLGAWGARRLTSTARHFSLSEHGIFFACALIGPLWAVLFTSTYPLMLDQNFGPAVLIGAGFGAAGLALASQRLTGSSVVPLPVWIGLYGVIAVAYEWQTSGDVVAAISLAGLIVTLTLLATWRFLKVTVRGSLLFAATLAGVATVVHWDVMWGRIVALLWVVLWLLLGQRWFRLPWSFWAVVAAAALVEVSRFSVEPANAPVIVSAYIMSVAAVLAIEFRRSRRQ